MDGDPGIIIDLASDDAIHDIMQPPAAGTFPNLIVGKCKQEVAPYIKVGDRESWPRCRRLPWMLGSH